MTSTIKAHDFFSQMQKENKAFRLVKSNIGADETVLCGTFSRTTIRDGLTIHYSDVTSVCDLDTEAESAPHLGIKLFFQGGVSARIGDQAIPMPCRTEHPARWIPSATLFHQQETELFRHRASIGDRISKLKIKILPEWLESGDVFGDARAQGLKLFTSARLAALTWKPSETLVSLATQVVRPPDCEPYLARLYVESRVISIIAEAFSLLTAKPVVPERSATLSVVECKRLRRAEALLKDSPTPPSVEALAIEVGVSVNTLQRLFHAAHHTTVFHYIRKLKMEQARKALEDGELTIAQAAYMAGYASPANFATAFKRMYALSPRQARLRG
ncbi:AraC family transcriptional regulator [Rhizobium sp. SSA_523]|uniref:helix-turn-helix transcriptional regulator n=1 Tax=Rhizobium sp. SSA_523 TaxID=2952477 RepID=UPI00209015FD|nr:AraC family transcriptional regulator [Rhizobium sp. SSA_523]MCO5732812.1 AraC family transcriptional regulator [Rhizobium sp. SSA_523]WKC23570.1 AraC family transcriptional regulator [Rhizobium sp. SSA_523]